MRLLIAAIAFVAVAASAQSDAVIVQRVINDAGNRCDRVVNFRPGLAVDNGDSLVIADCSDGSSHVIRVTADNRIRYYMKCGSFLNPVKC